MRGPAKAKASSVSKKSETGGTTKIQPLVMVSNGREIEFMLSQTLIEGVFPPKMRFLDDSHMQYTVRLQDLRFPFPISRPLIVLRGLLIIPSTRAGRLGE